MYIEIEGKEFNLKRDLQDIISYMNLGKRYLITEHGPDIKEYNLVWNQFILNYLDKKKKERRNWNL